MIKRILLILFLCFLVYGKNIGGAMGVNLNYKEQIKEKYKNIDLSDGVSKEEAIIIAQNYLIGEELDKICDIATGEVVGDMYNNPGYWHVSFSATHKVKREQGLKWASVYVNKRTGEVKYGGEGPS